MKNFNPKIGKSYLMKNGKTFTIVDYMYDETSFHWISDICIGEATIDYDNNGNAISGFSDDTLFGAVIEISPVKNPEYFL